MAKLLSGVTVDTTGSVTKVVGPTSIFIESTNFGGGTVSLYAQRTATSNPVLLGQYTAQAVVNDSILGTHYLYATLAGSTGAAAVTVAVAGAP